jgi:hypothetical protein
MHSAPLLFASEFQASKLGPGGAGSGLIRCPVSCIHCPFIDVNNLRGFISGHPI